MVRDLKNFGPKLNATTLTLPGPPRPGPGYDVPPEPPLTGPEDRSLMVPPPELTTTDIIIIISVSPQRLVRYLSATRFRLTAGHFS